MYGLFGITLLMLTVALASAADPELTFQPPGIVKQGDTLTLTCKVNLETPLDAVKLTKKYDAQEFPIATNDFIASKELEARYTAELKDGALKLTIDPVTGQDMGNYECFKLGDDRVASERPQIRVPVKRVALQFKEEDTWQDVTDGEERTFRETEEPMPVRCIIEVEGSEEKPSYGVTFGGDNYIGSNKFTEMVKQNAYANESGLVTALYKNTLSYDLVRDRDISGKTLECFAEMEEFEKVSVSVTFNIQYPPEVVNCVAIQKGEMDTENAEIACILKMAPMYTEYSWSMGEGDNMTTLMKDEEKNGFTASVEDMGQSDYKFVVKAAKVTSEAFQTYTITVGNGVGQFSQSIKFEEEYKPEPETSPKSKESTTGPPIIIDRPKTEENKGNTASHIFLSWTTTFGIACLLVTSLL